MDLMYYISLVIRSVLLGVIVFGSTTYIPNKLPSMRNRLIISATVVILYALLDYINAFLQYLRFGACNLLCPPPSGSTGSLEKELDINLEDIENL